MNRKFTRSTICNKFLLFSLNNSDNRMSLRTLLSSLRCTILTKNIIPISVSNLRMQHDISSDIKEVCKDDQPIELEKNPFEKEKEQCILCKYNIKPDYKNVRLLSQFCSSYTGRLYGRHITRLCEHKHNEVEVAVTKARQAGLMGYVTKARIFLEDPQIFDPEKPLRPHKY